MKIAVVTTCVTKHRNLEKLNGNITLLDASKILL